MFRRWHIYRVNGFVNNDKSDHTKNRSRFRFTTYINLVNTPHPNARAYRTKQFNQDGSYALAKARMRSAQSRSFPMHRSLLLKV